MLHVFFLDFRIANNFLVEILPKCSVINSNLPWKKSELYEFIFSDFDLI
jgi:hypothetical protein